MNTRDPSLLTHTWRAQIRRLAAHNPWLAQQVWQNRQAYFDRFVHFYRQLGELPRKVRHKFLRRLATTLAGAALLLTMGHPLPARAAVITVDGVVCTLGNAITAANTDTATGGCPAGSGADVIDLQTDVTLSAPLPHISSEITLEGNGHTIQPAEGSAFRVLYVELIGELILNNAVITGGAASDGGGIYNRGQLTVNTSTISGNSGGGIHNYEAFATVNNSTISDNMGGGIYLYKGGVSVIHSTISGNYGSGIFSFRGGIGVFYSTISGNSAGDGGGIYNGFESQLFIDHSTLGNNSATNRGGGLFNHWYNWTGLTINFSTISGNSAEKGGGIFNDSSSFGSGARVFLNNSTLSGNVASLDGGGIFNNGTPYDSDSFDGKVYLRNSTLSDNLANMHGGGIWNWGRVSLDNSTLTGNSADLGGGVFNYNYYYSDYYEDPGTVNLNRSLVSGNSAGSGPEVYASNGIVYADNFNVIGYEGDARSYGFTPGVNDLIPPGVLDTVLDTTLADNGGPTFTHALVSGSVAVDAAPDAACLAPPINGVDQRGFPRNVDGDDSPSSHECDSGAFEFTPSATPTPRPTSISRPTRTPTPALRPTRTPTPPAVQESALLPSPQAQTAHPLRYMMGVTLLALSNLFIFRKRRP